MTPQQFIEKWKDNPLKERASYQLHFIDLCALMGVPTPSPATAETYCFERGATRTGAGQGWADVWKQSHFAFEYKATRRNLGEALKQLMTYALALDNPPLLVVCDTNIIQIHTHFTNAPSEVHTIALEEISEPANLEKLRWLFTAPDKFLPKRTIFEITEEAAGKFAHLAQSLNTRGHDPQTIAHFLNQCLFCLFAEDAELLPGKLFERLLDKSQTDPDKLTARLQELFNAMRKGGDFALEDIHWFNGGLFETVKILPLTTTEIKMLHEAAKLDWSGIEPSIFGTLFERGLDPSKRSQLGAHYTDPQSIMRIINPVIVEPFAKEWEVIRQKISELHPKFALIGKKRDTPNEAMKEGYKLFLAYLERIKNFRVLDPACGSGNFLYLALRALKDLEHRANLDAESLGLHRQITIECSPANMLGIELNTYAAELARVTVWIGEIQWMLKNGYPIRKNPILQPLDHIENRDAVLNADGSEAQWPAVDAIIGNPPFLGDKKMRNELGNDYTEALRKCYAGRVSGGADLVTYWFEKARAQIEAGKCQRAGLVATNSIRFGKSNIVIAKISDELRIFHAWSDEPWINEGASVRVSIVCFDAVANCNTATLNGLSVGSVRANLDAVHDELDEFDLSKAKKLKSNQASSYIGVVLVGEFEVPPDVAREMLASPNPHGLSNSDVLKRTMNGMDITRRPAVRWVVDFGATMTEADASLYEKPFQWAEEKVKPSRLRKNKNGEYEVRRRNHRDYWWRYGESRPAMRAALAGLNRFIVAPMVSKHRLFVWMSSNYLPDQKLVTFPSDSDIFFGILSSRFHVLWSISLGNTLEDRPTYNSATCFETFPFPEGIAPNLAPDDYTNTAAAEIASAAQALNKLRDNWFNPPEWVDWERTPEEEKAGYPARAVAKPGHEAELKKRTLTNLYNARPAWLDNAHKTLDAAVAKAYGWNDYTPEMPDEEILRRLLVMNLTRA